jgi:hypothetical protein
VAIFVPRGKFCRSVLSELWSKIMTETFLTFVMSRDSGYRIYVLKLGRQNEMKTLLFPIGRDNAVGIATD